MGRRALFFAVILTLTGTLVAVSAALRLDRRADVTGARPPPVEHEVKAAAQPSASPSPEGVFAPGPINDEVKGLTTFRGNESRSYYGEGPVPQNPVVLWRYPADGAMCAESDDGYVVREWCGTGWTGQPNVVEIDGGRVEVRFGAYDRGVHVVDGRTGRDVKEPFFTGDLIKGTVTSDPDGYPLLYSGSRDNYFRVFALDRGRQLVELWKLGADSAPYPVWNTDWDGSALIVGDYLLEGGENSWFYVVKLNRNYDEDGKVTVDPEIKMMVPGFDDELFGLIGDASVSIENSVAFRDGVVYFSNGGGLVQGWDISDILAGGTKYEQVFRFWAGDDMDASIVIDEEGFLYASSEVERSNARSTELGQLLKLDPTKDKDPLVWGLSVPGYEEVMGGIWGTPALYGEAVFITTNTGGVWAVDRESGKVAWKIGLPGPTWSSPVVIDNTLIVGDCAGVLHAFDLGDDPLAGKPQELWQVTLSGCIESTPAVWKGVIYVGDRGGRVNAIGDPGSL